MALDSELRELLKSRIKQASELLPEAPREPLSLPKESDAFKPVSRSKFVGGAKPPQEPPAPRSIARQVPADIRKACMILGIRPEELTPQVVLNAWKHQIATPGVHPDLGGDTELAIFLNMAKDQLVRWLDPQVPKLAKKFKSTQSTHKQSTP